MLFAVSRVNAMSEWNRDNCPIFGVCICSHIGIIKSNFGYVMALRIFVFIFCWNFLLAVRQTNPDPNAIFSMYHIPRHFHQTKSIINQNTSLLTQTHIHASQAGGEEDSVYYYFFVAFDRWRYSWFGSRRSINKIIAYAISVLSFAYNVHTILILSLQCIAFYM